MQQQDTNAERLSDTEDNMMGCKIPLTALKTWSIRNIEHFTRFKEGSDIIKFMFLKNYSGYTRKWIGRKYD